MEDVGFWRDGTTEKLPDRRFSSAGGTADRSWGETAVRHEATQDRRGVMVHPVRLPTWTLSFVGAARPGRPAT